MKCLFNKFINSLLSINIPKNCRSCRHKGLFGCTYNKECVMYKTNRIYPHSLEEDNMWKDLYSKKLWEYYLTQPPY